MRSFAVACLVAVAALAISVSAHEKGEFHPNGIEGEMTLLKPADAARLRQAAADLGVKTAPGRMYSNWVITHPLTAAPEQLHLSITAEPGNISIIWVTSTASNASQVCVRPASSNVSYQCHTGTSWTYTPTSVLPWTGMIHGAYMTRLTPGSWYEYYVGDPTLQVFSNVTTFVCPDFANPDKELFVALGGDMGTIQLFGHYVAKQMLDDYRNGPKPFDAFWLIGDIAYSTLDPPKWNFEFFWDMFFRQEAPLVQHIPLLASFGNHDFSGGHAGAYINRFRMPQGGRGLGNFYWSYTHGPVKYISMCTEVGLEPSLCTYAPGSRQYRWLVKELRNVNRSQTPWVVLAGHRPMYSSDKATDSGPLQRYIEPLLIQYGVDVELAGHMHATELSAPVAYNVANMSGVVQLGESRWQYNTPQAPVHITAGCLGAVIREKFTEPRPSWSLFRNGTFWDNTYGYVTLKANRTSMEFRFLRTANNAELWSVTINK